MAGGRAGDGNGGGVAARGTGMLGISGGASDASADQSTVLAVAWYGESGRTLPAGAPDGWPDWASPTDAAANQPAITEVTFRDIVMDPRVSGRTLPGAGSGRRR